jgi:hypothetical protein
MKFPNRLWPGPGQRLTSLCMIALAAIMALRLLLYAIAAG